MAHHKRKKKHHHHHNANNGGEARIDRSADEVEFADESEFAADEVIYPGNLTGFAADEVEFGEETVFDRPDNRIHDDNNYGDRWGMEGATEIAPTDGPNQRERDGVTEAGETEAGRGLGIFGLVLSVLSFFIVPFLLGPAGIILGIISIRRGSRWGMWAVGLGVVSIILTAFVAPIAGF